MAAVRQENGLAAGASSRTLAVSLLLSNQNAVAYLSSDFSPIEQNVLSSTLEFTNGRGSAFNNGFTPLIKSNP